MSYVTRSQAKELIGKHIYAARHDGSVLQGKLVRISGDELIIVPRKSCGLLSTTRIHSCNYLLRRLCDNFLTGRKYRVRIITRRMNKANTRKIITLLL
jgi:hypothetical protein